MLGIETPTLIVWMASLAAIVTVLAIAAPFFLKSGSSTRMKAVTQARKDLSRKQMEGLESKAPPFASARPNRGSKP